MNDVDTKTTSDNKNYSFTVNGQHISVGVDPACGPDVAYVLVNDPTTGVYQSSASIINIRINSHIDDVYNLFFAGKTIKDNADEYMEVINRLPEVTNQLEAIETLEFFRKQMFPESDEK